MLDIMKTGLIFLENNLHNIFVYTVIMVSAIIVAIGLLKPVLFNKIKSKQLRKATLAFSNVALCFLSIFFVYIANHWWDFKYYVAVSTALSIACIVTYWFYENTCLRNLIATIGKIALRKLGNVAIVAINSTDIEEIKTEAKKATAEIKAKTESKLKKTTTQAKKDKDLEGL